MIQSLKSDITEDNITMCMEKNGQYTTQIQSLEEQLRQNQIELLKTQADLIKCLKSNQ
jgi:outer membrane lipopolysaccharide assembly protein LptE/RlpB